MDNTVTIRRLFTEIDMATAYLNGFANGWVRVCPATDKEGIIRLFAEWLDTKYPEGCEAEIRAEERPELG